MSTLIPRYLEWYEVDGIELATFGYAISSISNGTPDRKGKNYESPVIHGDQFRQKRLSPRKETWTIWICDAHPTTGVIPSTEEGKRAQYNENYDTIMKLLNNTAELLTVKHYRIISSSPTVYAIREGFCEIEGSFSIDEHRELMYSQFGVDVSFPDPRWYEETGEETTLTANLVSASSTSVAHNGSSQAGTAPITYMQIIFQGGSGGLVNPKLTNSTYPNSTSTIGYTGTIAAGHKVYIDTDSLSLETWNPATPSVYTNAISGLYRYGSRQDWMEIFPTSNTLTFSATSGQGTITIIYKKTYI